MIDARKIKFTPDYPTGKQIIIKGTDESGNPITETYEEGIMVTAEERIQVMNTMIHHRLQVQSALLHIISGLQRRSLVHDESKFRTDEFEGFAAINKIARDFKYGSEEYKNAIKNTGKVAVDLHYSRNSHHPEYFKEPWVDMSLLDIIEMTCDWYGAWRVYDGQRPPEMRVPWLENISKQKERFMSKNGLLSDSQWWVVEQVAAMLLFSP